MINILRQHIIDRLGNDIEKLDEVLEHFKPIKVKRNQQLLQQGEICKYVYFVATGCLQVYVYDADANETTRDIITENNWCSELISFGRQQPATENIKAVEPCDLFAIDQHGFHSARLHSLSVFLELLHSSLHRSIYSKCLHRQVR